MYKKLNTNSLRSYLGSRFLKGKLLLLLFIVTSAGSCPGDDDDDESIETGGPEFSRIIRDSSGVPHIFAPSDTAAFFAWGYVTAEDRFFQMSYDRLIGEGRTAEFFGAGPNQVYLNNDFEVRLMGYQKYADKVIGALEQEALDEQKGYRTLDLLAAYARGVNRYVEDHPGKLSPLFVQYGIPIDDWKPRDIILLWLNIGHRFSNSPFGEAKSLHEYEMGEDFTVSHPLDEAAAVVQESDVSAELKDEIQAFANFYGYGNFALSLDVGHGLGQTLGHGATVKMSQSVAIGRSRSESGRIMLQGEPRMDILRPSAMHEFKLSSPNFNARGVVPPGTFGILVGSTDQVAWSPTAAAGDQADLYRLDMSCDSTDQYRFHGVCKSFSNVDENIEVKILGQSSEFLTYKESYWGPVVTSVVDDVYPGEEYALKSIAFSDPANDSIHGFLEMMGANSASDFYTAIEKWTFPAVHVVYASEDTIGYQFKGPIPLRSLKSPFAGKVAQDGSDTSFDWLTLIPQEYLPGVQNPERDYIVSGNHMPVGSWYPMPLGIPTGGRGDTHRSRRLREVLLSQEQHSFEDLRLFHTDAIEPVKRDFVILGRELLLKDALLPPASRLSSRAKEMLQEHLIPWLESGAQMTDDHRGVALAHFMKVNFRKDLTGVPLQHAFGGGENGANFWAKTKIAQLEADPDSLLLDPSPFESESARYIDAVIVDAFAETTKLKNAGSDSDFWLEWYRSAVLTNEFEASTVLREKFPSLDPTDRLVLGPLYCTSGNTLAAQLNNVYSQAVRFGEDEVEEVRAVLPFGQSEQITGRYYENQIQLHEDQELRQVLREESSLEQSGAPEDYELQVSE